MRKPISFCRYSMLLYMLAGIMIYAHGQNVTLGTRTGAGSTNVLLSTSTTTNKYSKTISIYSAAEIAAAGGVAGNVSSLWWMKEGTGEYTTNDAQIKVWLKHVSYTTWGSVPDFATEVATASEVYSSNSYSIPTGTGWKQVSFASPFAWNGTGNLAVFVEWFRNSAPSADINWARSTDNTTNATRVGTTANLVMLINNNRPLLQLQINAPFPVTISSINARKSSLSDVQLQWTASTETGIDRYDIEVAADGNNYTVLGSVPAKPLALSNSYTYIHSNARAMVVSNRRLFYRLRTHYTNGSVNYSKTLPLNFDEAQATNVVAYPNPVRNNLTLAISSEKKQVFTYCVYDLAGKLVLQNTGIVEGSLVISEERMAAMPVGLYTLAVIIGEERKWLKLVKGE